LIISTHRRISKIFAERALRGALRRVKSEKRTIKNSTFHNCEKVLHCRLRVPVPPTHSRFWPRDRLIECFCYGSMTQSLIYFCRGAVWQTGRLQVW